MRIAFVSLMSGVPWGGSEVLWSKTASLALDEGNNVFISVLDWGKSINQKVYDLQDQGAVLNLRRRKTIASSLLNKVINFIRTILLSEKSRWRKLIHFKPEIVLINQGGSFEIIQHDYALYEALKKHNIKYVLLSHNHPQFSYIPEQRIYTVGRRVFENASACIFVSDTHRRVVEKSILATLNNSVLTFNPLNLRTFDIIDWPASKKFNVAIVAALLSGKGHDIAFEILGQEKWLSRKWMLNIYGQGDGKDYLQNLVEHYGLNDRVVFHGHIESASDIWKDNHILLLPSSGEGLPISIVEAMVCGRPVVSTDVGGITEIIEDQYNGFVAEGLTITSVEKSLEKAYTCFSELESIGKNAHNSIKAVLETNPERKLLTILLN